MKKFILGLGTLASTIAPVAAVVACGTDSNGLPTLTAEESTMLVKTFAEELGITGKLTGATDEFQIKFNSASETGVEFTLERNAKSTFHTGATIHFSNLENSGTALELAIGEVLKFNLALNAAKNDLTTKTFTLSGSKTVAKNGVYLPAAALDSTKLVSLIKKVIRKAVGINETITLTTANKATVISTLQSSAISAEVIFKDDIRKVSGTNPAAWTNLSVATLKSKVSLSGAFDFTFDLTTSGGQLFIFGETEQLTVVTGGKSTIHLVGVIGTAGYTLTTKTATVGTKTITLNDAGAKKLAMALNTVAATA